MDVSVIAEANSSLDNDRDGSTDRSHNEAGILPVTIDNHDSRATENENKFQSAISAWRRGS